MIRACVIDLCSSQGPQVQLPTTAGLFTLLYLTSQPQTCTYSFLTTAGSLYNDIHVWGLDWDNLIRRWERLRAHVLPYARNVTIRDLESTFTRLFHSTMPSWNLRPIIWSRWLIIKRLSSAGKHKIVCVTLVIVMKYYPQKKFRLLVQ